MLKFDYGDQDMPVTLTFINSNGRAPTQQEFSSEQIYYYVSYNCNNGRESTNGMLNLQKSSYTAFTKNMEEFQGDHAKIEQFFKQNKLGMVNNMQSMAMTTFPGKAYYAERMEAEIQKLLASDNKGPEGP